MSSSANTINSWSSMPAEVVASFGDEGDFSRQFLLNPTIFTLLGDISDREILDAGCGNGYLSRLLAKQGASVTGLEPAAPLFNYARHRENEDAFGICYIQSDLCTWRSSYRFDWVIANMVLMDIDDLGAALDSCFFHLSPGGQLLISISHPCFEASDSEYLAKDHITIEEYFDAYPIKQEWGVRFHRPLSHYFQALIERDGIIRAVIEPQLALQNATHPTERERNVHIPSFIVIQVSKGS